jgi:hypothetical protein
MRSTYPFNPDGPILRGVRHSRKLLAGIQAKSGLDPRLKHSGVTVSDFHLCTRSEVSNRITNVSKANFFLFFAFYAFFVVSPYPNAAAAELPRVFILNPTYLLDTRHRIQKKPDQAIPAYQRLLRDTDRALASAPFSVVTKDKIPPSGDKHDYMSLAPYWWPDPQAPGGLPYIHLDGKINPERDQITDRQHLENMIGAVRTLALSYFLTRREDYAAHAARLLRVWFLEPATKMNPHLSYAQAVPGRNHGSVSGLIETHRLPDLIDSVGLLAGSKAWGQRDEKALQDWFKAFLNWLLESPQGRAEGKAQNNHGSWYDVQIASFALFIGDDDRARSTLREIPAKRIARQIEPDGSQPLELKRTRPWNYSIFNLEALFDAAALAEKMEIDLWNFATTDGRGIRRALDWLVPFATGEKRWAHTEMSNWRPQQLAPLLRRAARRYENDFYEQANRTIAGTPPDHRLNLLYPIRQAPG